MKYSILLALGLALTLPLQAGNKYPNRENKPKNHPAKAFNKSDKDGDGLLSKEEFIARAELVFQRKDKNSDGKLSRDEFTNKKPQAGKKGKGHQQNKAGKQNTRAGKNKRANRNN